MPRTVCSLPLGAADSVGEAAADGLGTVLTVGAAGPGGGAEVLRSASTASGAATTAAMAAAASA